MKAEIFAGLFICMISSEGINSSSWKQDVWSRQWFRFRPSLVNLMKKLKRELTFALINSLIWSFKTANRKIARQIGAFMGIIWIHLSQRDRFLTSRNLKIAYGNSLSTRGAERLARECFLNSGLFLADIVRMKDTYMTELTAKIDVEGLQNFDRAYRRNRGVIAARSISASASSRSAGADGTSRNHNSAGSR